MSTNRNCKPILKRTVVDITDPKYFCNKSWTLSYNVNTKSWVSFHSYIPNFYIAENNFFYSGLNSCCDDSISLDVISTVVLPPEPTTTTTSSSTSTTSSTTTKAPSCELEGTVSFIDCTLEGVATEAPAPSEICKCYTLVNNDEFNIAYYSYKQCGGGVIDNSEIYLNTIYICAVEGTVSVIGDVTITGPLGDCTTFENCTPSTTTTTTTACPNCKTYTLTNTTNFVKTATQLIDCETGLEYTKEVPANSVRHACSCNNPVVPTGLTKEEYGDGCTKCFCYTLQNIQNITTYVGFINCSGQYREALVEPYSTVYICAMDGTVEPTTGINISGGTNGCATNEDCDCWEC